MRALIIVYAIVLLGALISLRKPVLGLFVYVGLAILRPEALWGWAGDLTGMSRLSGVPVLVGWAFQGFGSWRFGRARPTVALLLLFTLWSIISTFQSIDAERSWFTLLEFSKTLLPFMLGMTMITTEKEARQLLWVMVLCQTYVAFEMNQTYLTGYNRAFAEGFGGMDNNSLAICLLSTAGGALGLALCAKTWRSKAIAAVGLLLILHTILLTFSRGAFVGLLATGVVAVILLPKRPKYLGAVLIVGLIAFRLTGPELSARLATTFAPREERDGSAESRFSLWADCFVIISRHPVLGVGPQNWPVVAAEFGWPEGKEAHSVWIQTAAEVGVPGALFLLMFYGVTVVRLWPIARGRTPGVETSTSMFAVGIILSIVGYAVSAQFVSLQGLEPPFYIAMIGAVLLKVRTLPEAAVQPTKALQPVRPTLRPRTPLARSS